MHGRHGLSFYSLKAWSGSRFNSSGGNFAASRKLYQPCRERGRGMLTFGFEKLGTSFIRLAHGSRGLAKLHRYRGHILRFAANDIQVRRLFSFTSVE
jgi:hypothetical protein